MTTSSSSSSRRGEPGRRSWRGGADDSHGAHQDRPVFTVERFDDPKWRSDRTLYESGSLRFLPGQDTVPLIVDHNEERVIGTVHELFRMDWIDGPWIVARCTVDDRPAWLQRNTRASFGFKCVHRRELKLHGVEAEVMASALVTEVSVLPDYVQPAEPLAAVLSIRVIESSPATVTTSDRAVAGGTVLTGVIRRYYETPIRVR